MGRHFSHLHTAIKVIGQYTGSMPFNSFMKAFFAKEKRYGSKDRKQIATLCYNYFRSGPLLKNESVEEKIITSVFLSKQTESDFLSELRPDLMQHVGLSFSHKLVLLNKNINAVFPYFSALSTQIDAVAFVASLFVQPDLFVRVRPGKREIVEQKLMAADVPFEFVDEECISLSNSTKTENILTVNEEVVIQDRNSQKVLDHLRNYRNSATDVTAWDCCAASGGKSILLYDRLRSKVRLTVTDIRETILSNLHTRLHKANVPIKDSHLVDLTKAGLPVADTFDIILCDAPCTGSGTWSRTPEQMFYFNKNKIQMYAAMQRQIVTNSISSLKHGSLFFYITCSVFEQENEQQMEFIKSNFAVKLVHVEYLRGYEQKADTMFVAVFQS